MMESPVAIVVFLQADDRNRVKLTHESSATKPASMIRFCIPPTSRGSRVAAEKRIWMEVRRHSHPKRLLEMTIKTVMHSVNAAMLMGMAQRIFMNASVRLPYFVLRRMSSAPVWYSLQNSGVVTMTHRNMRRKRYIPTYSVIFVL